MKKDVWKTAKRSSGGKDTQTLLIPKNKRIWDHLHKSVYRFKTKTLCMHKDRKIHTYFLVQIYKTICAIPGLHGLQYVWGVQILTIINTYFSSDL